MPYFRKNVFSRNPDGSVTRASCKPVNAGLNPRLSFFDYKNSQRWFSKSVKNRKKNEASFKYFFFPFFFLPHIFLHI